MKMLLALCLVTFTMGCSLRDSSDLAKVTLHDSTAEISLGYDIKIVIPHVGTKFDTCKHYSQIEVWKSDKIAFRDTTGNEYMFMCNKLYTIARKLDNNRYEVLIEKFDGPDIDKTLALYLTNSGYESEKILPYFESAAERIDGKLVYHGVLHTMDGYDNDSCYYNPTLYYEDTSNGLLLDSVMTEKKVTERWGKFYGYEQSDKIILPCKR